MDKSLLYKGNQLKKPYTFMSKVRNKKGEITTNRKEVNLQPYVPGKKLIEAIHLAQILQRPLLLQGEPGCGKSRVAESIAFEFFGEEHYNEFYFRWNVKSTSKASDGLYVIDHLQRLRDAGLQRTKKSADGSTETAGENLTLTLDSPYLSLGELGQAFKARPKLAHPPVVLIDEIDKADIDFPNDLLQELDRMDFEVPGAVDKDGNPLVISADKDKRPLIIITSNEEKTLPPAFLRRCLFHYIDFEDIDLKGVIDAHNEGIEAQLRDEIVQYFNDWRTEIKAKGLNKNINTSELLDWIRIVQFYVAKGEPLPPLPKKEGEGVIPWSTALLKDVNSLKIFINPKK